MAWPFRRNKEASVVETSELAKPLKETFLDTTKSGNPRREIADLTCVVKLSGHRIKSLKEAKEYMAPTSTKRINTRTGKPFTVIHECNAPAGEKDDKALFFKVTREGIRGNYPSDLKKFVVRQMTKGTNARSINVDILRPQRKVWENQ